MARNIVKIIEKRFADIEVVQKMLISSPEQIAAFIFSVPHGSLISVKEMRFQLANSCGADNTCPVTTGIFLKMAIEQYKENPHFPYWRVIDHTHPVVKKLNLNENTIKKRD